MPRALENKSLEDPMKRSWRSDRYTNFYKKRWLKKQIVYGIEDAATTYKSDTGCSKDLKEKYKDVVSMFFEEVSKAMIQKNYPYFWYRVGEFFIAKFNGSPILHSSKSRDVKRTVSFVNLHTSGWVYQFYWQKNRCVFYNRDCYEFRPYEGREGLNCGRYALKKHIRKLHADNKLTDYNAFVRNDAMVWKRRKKREAEAAQRLEKKEQKLKALLS